MLTKIKKTNKSSIIILALISFIFLIPLFTGFMYHNINMPERETIEDNQQNVLFKASGSWNLTSDPIFIDGMATGVDAHNWSWAENQTWCSGHGSIEDPYIIENVTIDCLNAGMGITINNSDVYLRIKNCTIYNSSKGINDAGIFMENVNNSQIINNTLYDNQHGIGMTFCTNINITLNNFINNEYSGVGLTGSSEIIITKNQLQGNRHAIILLASENNTIHNNTMKNNNYGITLQRCFFEYSRFNNITQNFIVNNTQIGINLTDYAISNLLYNNSLLGNTINAIDETGLNYWNSSEIGNYWDDYDGFDLNEDGRGETPYLIYNSSGRLKNRDYIPIWDVPDEVDPVITPKISTTIFGKGAPIIELTIDEYDLKEIWFTINGGEKKYYFSGNSFTIDQELWNALPDGTHTIRIYAKDTSDNVGFFDLTIMKVAFLSDLILIIITTLIILLVVGFGSLSAYLFVFKPYISDKKKAKNIIKQWNSENHIIDKFRIAKSSNDIDILKNDEFTLVSEEFMVKVDKLQFSLQEKEEFLKDMLLMTPEMRNEFIDEILNKE